MITADSLLRYFFFSAQEAAASLRPAANVKFWLSVLWLS
jgi:hypothetical protein